MFFKLNKNNKTEKWLIAGLGNPGSEYQGTRHNCGFAALDIIAEKLGTETSKKKFKALVGSCKKDEKKIILMKPQTFMNLSGEAIQEAANWHKISPARIIVIYDDIDLNPGAIRVREKGSAGSHNGMKSVVKMLSNQEFPRVRIGIGKQPPFMDLADYVLGRIPKEEQPLMNEAFEKAADAALSIIEKGCTKTMSIFNKG